MRPLWAPWDGGAAGSDRSSSQEARKGPPGGGQNYPGPSPRSSEHKAQDTHAQPPCGGGLLAAAHAGEISPGTPASRLPGDAWRMTHAVIGLLIGGEARPHFLPSPPPARHRLGSPRPPGRLQQGGRWALLRRGGSTPPGSQSVHTERTWDGRRATFTPGRCSSCPPPGQHGAGGEACLQPACRPVTAGGGLRVRASGRPHPPGASSSAKWDGDTCVTGWSQAHKSGTSRAPSKRSG